MKYTLIWIFLKKIKLSNFNETFGTCSQTWNWIQFTRKEIQCISYDNRLVESYVKQNSMNFTRRQIQWIHYDNILIEYYVKLDSINYTRKNIQWNYMIIGWMNDTLNSIQWILQRKSNACHTVIDWLNVLGNVIN